MDGDAPHHMHTPTRHITSFMCCAHPFYLSISVYMPLCQHRYVLAHLNEAFVQRGLSKQ